MLGGKSGSDAAAPAGAAASEASAARTAPAATRARAIRAGRGRGARSDDCMPGGCQTAPPRRHAEMGPADGRTLRSLAFLDSDTYQCHYRRMPEDAYSLADLARLADVTPRTVRYYVSQGLLPSPEAAGPATRYGEGHLARLRLIKRLQREHLPLAEIRARLERLGDDEVGALRSEGRRVGEQ